MRTRPDHFYVQSAVVPIRRSDQGLEVLLVSSRKRKRWIVPKGVIEPGTEAGESAAREALEEAGIEGRVVRPALGRYAYDKWGGRCEVEVFVLEVDTVHEAWLEDFRDRVWLSVEEAAGRVDEEALQAMIRSLAPGVVPNS